METFAKVIPRWVALTASILALALIPPEVWARGPNLCLWTHLFHLNACPACGSTRALAAIFHGHLTQALDYNHNVMVTAPTLIAMVLHDVASGIKRLTSKGTGPSA